MTVVAVARDDGWTALLVDAVKGRLPERTREHRRLRLRSSTSSPTRSSDLVARTRPRSETRRFSAQLRSSRVGESQVQPISRLQRCSTPYARLQAPSGTFTFGRTTLYRETPHTFVVCTETEAFFWEARLDVNTFVKARDFAQQVPDGRALVLYGGVPEWKNAPPRPEVAREMLKERIYTIDIAARDTWSPTPLPYDLRYRWSWLLLRTGFPTERRSPFESIDELLANAFEATDEILMKSVAKTGGCCQKGPS